MKKNESFDEVSTQQWKWNVLELIPECTLIFERKENVQVWNLKLENPELCSNNKIQ